jgi:hypothetical protein
MKLFKLTAIATALIAASAAQAATNVSTNIEMNNLWVTDLGLTQTGRVEVNLDSKQGKDYTVSAKASLIAKHNGVAATDDMWIQLGNASGALKLGLFEAANLFPLSANDKGAGFGGENVLYKAAGANGYYANALRGRDVAGAMSNSFHGALTGNFGPVGVELGLVESKNKASFDNVKGVRPVLTGELGMFKISAGVEATKSFNGTTLVTTSTNGFGITGGFKLAEGQFNVNYASVKSGTVKNNSFGLNGTFGPLVAGVVADKQTSKPTATTVYASYTMSLFGIPGASVTPALSYSKASGVDAVTAANVRLNYAF